MEQSQPQQPRKFGGQLGSTKYQPPINSVAIQQRKMEVTRLLVEGATVAHTAELVGISEQTVFNYIKDPEVRKQIAELNSVVLTHLDEQLVAKLRTKVEVIDELATIALDEMRKILVDPNSHASVKAKMIDSALDRCPEVSRTKKLDVTQRSFTMKAEDLLLAAQAARDVEERSRQVAEAEVNEVNSEQNLPRE